jgi:thiol-disulfide isomerase/thioredoxin
MNKTFSVLNFQFFLLILLSPKLFSQDVSVVKFSELENFFHRDNDTTYVINFWATWCSPCVEELPYFERLGAMAKTENRKLRVMLVSLDFRSQLETTLKPFIRKKNLRSDIFLLNESDANSYIDRISKDWSGAIPATLIVNADKFVKKFFEKKFESFEDLNSSVTNALNKKELK